MAKQHKAILAATKKVPPGGDYVWGSKDENDRPLTREEMQKGVDAYRKKCASKNWKLNKRSGSA